MLVNRGAVQIDTDPHPAFPVLSAGNLGEVAPERISITSWSLLGDPVERGLRALAGRLWPRARWYTGSRYVFVGYVSCRPYHNLSAFCHMARHVPGLRGDDVTLDYFQGTSAAPSPRSLLPGRFGRALSVPRVAREILDLAPRTNSLEGAVAELEGRARIALASGSAIGLGETFTRAREVVDDAWALHYLTTLVLVPIRRLLFGVGGRLSEHFSELEPWIAEVDEVVWSRLAPLRGIDQPLAPAEFLDYVFYEVADDRPPWSEFARARGKLRDPARAAATEAGRGDGGHAGLLPGNRSVWDVEPGLARSGLPQLTRLFADTMARREATKSFVMRTLHVCRRLLPAVAEAVGLDDDDWPYLTANELVAHSQPVELAELAKRRRRACADALERAAPETLDLRDGEQVPARAGDARSAGQGVSPGLVVGVVVDDPTSPSEPTEQSQILVCEAADAEIQPLLTLVDGLITARGSALSHVSILVREHGIPAVVGHPLARELKPGQVVRLNGTTGEVTLV